MSVWLFFYEGGNLFGSSWLWENVSLLPICYIFAYKKDGDGILSFKKFVYILHVCWTHVCKHNICRSNQWHLIKSIKAPASLKWIYIINMPYYKYCLSYNPEKYTMTKKSIVFLNLMWIGQTMSTLLWKRKAKHSNDTDKSLTFCCHCLDAIPCSIAFRIIHYNIDYVWFALPLTVYSNQWCNKNAKFSSHKITPFLNGTKLLKKLSYSTTGVGKKDLLGSYFNFIFYLIFIIYTVHC